MGVNCIGGMVRASLLLDNGDSHALSPPVSLMSCKSTFCDVLTVESCASIIFDDCRRDSAIINMGDTKVCKKIKLCESNSEL